MSSLAGDVELIVLSAERAADTERLDAIVAMGAPHAALAALRDSARSAGDAPPPLVIALAPNGAASEHVRILGHEADLVLPALTHGRVVLATVLALIRWRDGR